MKATRTPYRVGLLALAFSSVAASAQPWFRGIGVLPGGATSSADAISADGLYVVGYSDDNQIRQAIRWTVGGGMLGLGDLPGGQVYSHARGVSAHGFHVVGSAFSASGNEGFRWQAGNMTGIGDLPGYIFSSTAFSISADGTVIAATGATNEGGTNHDQACRKVSAGPLVGLGDLAGGTAASIARDVSADGAVIVGEGNSTAGMEAFRWTTAAGMVGLGDLAGGDFLSAANATSADGSVVVGLAVSASGTEAFRWTQAGGMVGLGDLSGGAFNSIAVDASADGSVVVGYSEVGQFANAAFIWDAQHGMRRLQDVLVALGVDGLEGWQLISAAAVSADGLTVVGLGIAPEGHIEGWAAHLGQANTQTTVRASIGTAEQQGNGGSSLGSVSADGQVVAFWSNASNLVAGDTNAKGDIFVRNLPAGWTTRVSVSTAGAQANGDSINAQVSGNGRYVVFASDATNLVPGDTNGKRDIFLRDRVALTTTRLSISSAGAQANGASDLPRVSANGRFVAFQSDATNLVGGDSNIATDVFLRDVQTSTTTRISLSTAGAQGNGRSFDPTVSDDGLSVAFTSAATNLVAGDTNAAADVFFRNRSAGATVRVSVATGGAQGTLPSAQGRIAANGRHIAFTSSSPDLVADDGNEADDVFVRDRYNGTTVRISLAPAEGNGDSAAAAISANGRYVLYSSSSTNLVPGDTNGAQDVFVHDGWTLLTRRVSLGHIGQQAAGTCGGTSLSGDGRFGVFNSLAGNLVPGDTAFSDVFLRDLNKPE